MKKFKFGFTLGEVLMTLGIVGVIAAMTTPTLIENTNESKYRSLLKSFYSKYTVCLDSILTNAGAPEGASPCDSFDCYNTITADTFVNSELFNAAACTRGCSSVSNISEPAGFNSGKTYSLANDMTMKVMTNAIGCSAENDNITAEYKDPNHKLDVCALVYVDVNGQKGPNSFYHDIFAFFILSDKDIKEVEHESGTYKIKTIAHRSSQLLPLGLNSTKHGSYNSYITNTGGVCPNKNDNTVQDIDRMNCTAQIVDGDGYWKRRNSCWIKDNNTGDKKDCNKCNIGTDCYQN